MCARISDPKKVYATLEEAIAAGQRDPAPAPGEVRTYLVGPPHTQVAALERDLQKDGFKAWYIGPPRMGRKRSGIMVPRDAYPCTECQEQPDEDCEICDGLGWIVANWIPCGSNSQEET